MLDYMPRKATPARQAASRANGRKSTGPKTLMGKKISSLNALQRGRSAHPCTRPLWQAMVALGEDPSRYEALLRDVTTSYPPRNALELTLCEDVTGLLLKLERNRQAQEAKVMRAFERLESSRQKQRREMEFGSSLNAPQSEVLEKGLLRTANSPAKFSEAEACLDRLQERLETGDLSDQAELNALYGKTPTFRGAGIVNGFRALAENPDDERLLSSLRLMLLEESRDLAEEYRQYLRDHVEVSRAMRLECLSPAAEPEYAQLQRLEATLNAQLERKIRLLLAMRTASRHEAAEALDVSVTKPLGWIDAAEPSGLAAGTGPLHPGKSPSRQRPKTAETSAVLLRHKMGVPRREVRKDQWEAIAHEIRAVYGLETPLQPTVGSGTSTQLPNGSAGAKEVRGESKRKAEPPGAEKTPMGGENGRQANDPGNPVPVESV